MDFNYTLKYRTVEQLLAEIAIDFPSFALGENIEPQQLIKIVQRVTYDLGLRVNMQKEIILEVEHCKAKLPNDFYTFNYGLLCGEYTVSQGYGSIGGTQMHEVPYAEFPATIDTCAAPTVNCRTCNCQPCNNSVACTQPANADAPVAYDPNNVYGDTCVQPRTFFNCKGEQHELIQIVNSHTTRVFNTMYPLRMKTSQTIGKECPNLYYNAPDEGWIKNGFLHTSFDTGKVYLNYQGSLEDCDGNLLIPDHPEINQYYEYALKERLLENLYINGSDVIQRLQLVQQRLREARNRSLSIVNTPNFEELRQVWKANRKAMYGKYYDMFRSFNPNGTNIL